MTYNEALLRAVEGWNANPIVDEWLFEKFRQQFVNTISGDEAFESIGPTVSMLLRQSDESTAIEVLQTVIALAKQSDTTEIPPLLLANRKCIADKFAVFGDYAGEKLKELFAFYRI